MLAKGIIEPTAFAYCSLVVLVKKKDGTTRFCINYRRLNTLTTSEATPMPAITEAMRHLRGANIFFSIDVKSGYWQIPVEEAFRYLTAFATTDGATYQFRVMPFGRKNAPGTFQRLMTQEVK